MCGFFFVSPRLHVVLLSLEHPRNHQRVFQSMMYHGPAPLMLNENTISASLLPPPPLFFCVGGLRLVFTGGRTHLFSMTKLGPVHRGQTLSFK